MLELRDYQRNAVNSLFEYWQEKDGSPLIVLPTGCHAKGTKILMYDGSVKNVEDILTNDIVMGPDSNPRRVVRTITGNEKMYKITPNKGSPFIVNENHVLSLKTTNEGKKSIIFPNSYKSGGQIENIKVGDYIGKSKSWKHIRKLWRTGVNFKSHNYEGMSVPPYIVGAMLGDGSIDHSASFTNMDECVLNEISQYAKSIGVNVRIYKKPNNKSVTLFFPDDLSNRSTRNRFVDLLDKSGIWGMRCHEKSIPFLYKTGNLNTRLELLAGLLDTDGHLSKNGHFDFISKSKYLSDDIAFVAGSVGLSAYVSECEKYCQTGGGGIYFRVSISGDVDIIPNRVDRQKSGKRKQKKNPLVTGFNVEYVGFGDFYGFELDGDHLYLTDDFTVHHNSGKSIVIATLVKELIEQYPDLRILCVTHVKELLVQNAQELLNIWPFAPVGFFSASLNRRDGHAQIVFGGVQTIGNKAKSLGYIDLVLVDESHTIPRDSDTQYGKLFAGLREINPDLKVVGLTATPFRLGEGLLTEGENAIFSDICFEKPIGEMIDEGYLCRPVSKGTEIAYDLKGIAKLGGDYKSSAMQAAFDKIDLNKSVVDEILTRGHDRKAWLLFCSGVEHSEHMRDEIRSRGITCEMVTGATHSAERDQILTDFKAGKIRALTNNSVLTTGTNIPRIDLVAFCRATLSPGLYIQMAGRGLRLFPGKKDCLFLDFAGVVRKHGPIDMVHPGLPRSGNGDAPIKYCPTEIHDKNNQMGCGSIVHASARKCSDCGFEFDIDDKPKIDAKPDDVPMLSRGEPEARTVTRREFRHHAGKSGKPDTVKCSYYIGMNIINEWICPGHSGYPKAKSDKFWNLHKGKRPFPKDAVEFLERQSELLPTVEIKVEPEGKYWSVVGHIAGDVVDNEVVEKPKPIKRASWMDEIDDDTCF